MVDPPAITLFSFLGRASGLAGHARSSRGPGSALLMDGRDEKAAICRSNDQRHQFKGNLFPDNQVFTLFAHPSNAGDARFICAATRRICSYVISSGSASLIGLSRSVPQRWHALVIWSNTSVASHSA